MRIFVFSFLFSYIHSAIMLCRLSWNILCLMLSLDTVSLFLFICVSCWFTLIMAAVSDLFVSLICLSWLQLVMLSELISLPKFFISSLCLSMVCCCAFMIVCS